MPTSKVAPHSAWATEWTFRPRNINDLKRRPPDFKKKHLRGHDCGALARLDAASLPHLPVPRGVERLGFQISRVSVDAASLQRQRMSYFSLEFWPGELLTPRRIVPPTGGVALSGVRVTRRVLRLASLSRHSADYIYHTGGLPGLCQQPNRPLVVSATSKLKAQQNICGDRSWPRPGCRLAPASELGYGLRSPEGTGMPGSRLRSGDWQSS